MKVTTNALCRARVGYNTYIIRTMIKMDGEFYPEFERFGVGIMDNSHYKYDIDTAEPLYPDEYEIIAVTTTYEPKKPTPIKKILEVFDIDELDEMEEENV